MNRFPLSSEVEKQLSSLILEKFPPGTKIPIELELAEMFQVSRTTIRSAVKALCSRNVLEIRRGDGTYVSKKPGLSQDALGLDFLEKNHLLQELREVSDLIQPAAAAMGAQRITEKDIIHLNATITALEQGFDDYKKGKINFAALRKLDSSFHSSVIKTSHNRIMDRLDDVFSAYLSSLKGKEIEDLGIIENSLKMHPKILEAMLAHDAQAAFDAMQLHLSSVALRFTDTDE